LASYDVTWKGKDRVEKPGMKKGSFGRHVITRVCTIVGKRKSPVGTGL
jgi:hypothetical protein